MQAPRFCRGHAHPPVRAPYAPRTARLTHVSLHPTSILPPPLAIPDHHLGDILGMGSYGTVYLATRQDNAERRAVKMVRVDADQRRLERFRRETRLCAALHHPHIVHLLDQGESLPWVYAVFEHVPGITLRQKLLQDGPLDPLEAGRLMLQVLDALACAHQAGIVHRDLKPENIMIATYGVVGHAKVLDFGISTLMPDFRDESYRSLTLDSECLGTPAYSAPEQLRGEATSPRSDLYAWALIFLECLLGRPLVEGSTVADVFYQQLSPHELTLPRAIGLHPLGALLRKALRKRWSERATSAQALLHELTRLRLDDLVGLSSPPPLPGSGLIATQTLTPPPPTGEKRQATLLCCGLTLWAGTDGGCHGPAGFEQQEHLLRDASLGLQEQAQQRGATLLGSLGNRFSLIFGYPRSTESDARLAALAAGEMLHRLEADFQPRARALGARLELRIGAHTGLVLVHPHEVSPGSALNMALLMENAAEAGQVLASESFCQRLQGRVRFEPVAPLGRADDASIPAFRMRTDTLHALETQHGMDAWHQHCIGRETQLAALTHAWTQVEHGSGSTWLLRGEAGVGKSCLATALQHHVQAQGGRCLWARALPELEHSALAPLLALLHDQLGPQESPAQQIARLTQHLHAAGCETERVLPILCVWLGLPPGRPSSASPALQKRLLVESILQWLRWQAQSAPLLLMVEDLHWADAATLEWLEHVATSLRSARILLVLSARPHWVQPATLALQVLELPRLGNQDAAQLVRQALAPRVLADEVVEQIAARTDGIPLFILELARMLLEQSLELRDGIWHFRPGAPLAHIPVTLRDSLDSRFEHLGPARPVIHWAATLGREFDLALLQACTTGSGLALEQGLQILLEADLIAPLDDGRRYVFRHALICDTAYAHMLEAQRTRQHAVVARCMRQLYPARVDEAPGLIAHHYSQAGLLEDALPLGLAQLRITQLRSLNDATLAYAPQVQGWLDALPPHLAAPARLEVHAYVTQALMNKHGWAHAQVASQMREAESLLSGALSPTLRARHLWSPLTYYHVASARGEVMRLAQELEKLALEAPEETVAAQLWLGLAHFSEGHFDQAERALGRALAAHTDALHAHHAADFGFDTRVWALATRGLVRWGRGEDQAALTDSLEAVARARQIDHIPSLGIALLYLALAYQGRDEAAHARSTCDELLTLAHQYGLPAFIGYAFIIRCWSTGELPPADSAIQTLWDMGCRYCQTYYRAFGIQNLMQAGRWAEALTRLETALALVTELQEGLHHSELLILKARCLLAQGQTSAAGPVLLAAHQTALDGGKQRSADAAWALLQAHAPEQVG